MDYLGNVHSSKSTWKWTGAPKKTTIVYIGPSMSFHVNLGEGIRVLAKIIIYSRMAADVPGYSGSEPFLSQQLAKEGHMQFFAAL